MARSARTKSPYRIQKRRWPGPTPGTYRVAYRMDFIDPVTQTRSRPTLDAATAAEAAIEAQAIYDRRRAMAAPPEAPHVTRDITIAALLTMHRERNNIAASTARTEKFHANHLTAAAGELMLTSQINDAWIDDYVSIRRAAGVGDSTILKEIKTLLQACKWGFRRNICPRPLWFLPRLSPATYKPRCLTHDELASLLTAIGPETRTLRQLVELFYLTGLRRSEMLSLTWDNVNLNPDSPRITLITNKGGRANDRRQDVVFLSARAVRLLTLRRKASTSHLVFGDARFKSVKNMATTASLNKILARFANAAGIHNPHEVGVHTLRHTCATHLLRAGATAPDAAAHLRHRDGGSLLLRTYAHAHESAIREATERLTPSSPAKTGTNPVQKPK